MILPWAAAGWVASPAPGTPTSASYLDLPTVVVLVLGLVVAGVCTIVGLRGRPPGRGSFAAVALLQVAVTGLAGVYAGRALSGQDSTGPAWELWSYLVTVVLLPAVAWIWARTENSRWGSFVLAMAAFVAAVMAARSAQIWYGVGLP